MPIDQCDWAWQCPEDEADELIEAAEELASLEQSLAIAQAADLAEFYAEFFEDDA